MYALLCGPLRGSGIRNPRFGVWSLELGLGTRNPRFVAWLFKLGSGTHNPCFAAWSLELALGTGLPPFRGQDMQGALFTQWTPTKSIPTCCLTRPTSTHPPTSCPTNLFLGTLEQQEVPTYGHLLFWGVGPFGVGCGGPPG